MVVATRRKPDGSEKVDIAATIQRYLLALMAVGIGTLCPWTRPLFGLPSSDRDTQVLQDIKQDVSTMKTDVKILTARVDNIDRQIINGAIEGFWKGRR